MNDSLVSEWVSVPDAAERLGVDAGKIRQLVRDGRLLAVRRADGVMSVPAALLGDGDVVKGVPGVITVLRDGGWDDEEILEWLFTEDESLPGAPITALIENRGREVKRRAMALGL